MALMRAHGKVSSIPKRMPIRFKPSLPCKIDEGIVAEQNVFRKRGLMQREYHKFDSRHLNRAMEFLWFGHQGPTAVLFPTSMGRFYQYEDFSLISSLSEKIESGQLQLV